MLGLVAPAWADFADGAAAHTRGDYKEALQKLRPLAEQGNAYAQVYLGLMYYYGNGVEQDRLLAHMWFNVAASRFPPGGTVDVHLSFAPTVAGPALD